MNEVFSNAAIGGILFSMALSILVPIAAVVFLRYRYKARWVAALSGVLAFIVFALMLESMVNNAVLSSVSAALGTGSAGFRVFYVVYACLAAGLFEETARFITLRYVVKDPSLPDAMMYGAGHGGAEAILFTGLNNVGLYGIASMVNSYGVAETANMSYPDDAGLAAEFSAQLSDMLGLHPSYFFSAGIERLIAMALHVALSALVLYSIRQGAPKKYYLAAIALHAICNIPASLYQIEVISNIWLVEAITAALVAAAVFLVISLCKKQGVSLPANQHVDEGPRLR